MENSYNENHFQLKRVRRPINRPQSSENPQPSVDQSFNQTSSSIPTNEHQDKSIDDYLDEPNVPTRREQKDFYAQETTQPQYLDEESYQDELYGPRTSAAPTWLNTKVFVLITIIALFIGIVVGKFLFAESKVVRNGLQGVVANGEVPRGRARCGVAERSQGCVLYIMNPQRQEMRAKDFYDFAAQMTGRQRFMIETGNMRYANSKIKPGDIVQLNIPPL